MKDNTEDNLYKTRSLEIKALAGMSPEMFSDHLINTHNTLDSAAPNMAPFIYATANTAVRYLSGKLPKEASAALAEKPHPPSKAQQKDWLDIYDIVNNPVSILEHVKSGNVTNEQIQALQSVYPDLHNEMKAQIFEELGKRKGEKLSYAKKIAISKFIGQPVDSTMTLPSFQAILNTAAPPQEEQGAPKESGTQAQMKARNKVVDLYKTPGQASLIEKSKS